MSKFLKSLCKIAIPVTLQSMLQSSFSIVDQIMIGQLGETNISAVGLCGNFSLIFSVMIGAVSTVAGILIAQFIGAEESKEAWCSFDVSLICGIIMSVLFLLAAGVFPSQILGLYTKDMSIVNTGTVYFRIVALSYIPMAVSNILSSWLRCKEYATIPFLASFGAVIVNTGLNYLLIFGKFGFPCMEIKGAAIATLISQLFNLVFIVIGFVLCIKKDLPSRAFCSRPAIVCVRIFSRSISATADSTEIISFPASLELSMPSSTQIRLTPKSCMSCKEFRTSAAFLPNLESLKTST